MTAHRDQEGQAAQAAGTPKAALAALLADYSVEVTSRDRRGIDAAIRMLRPDTRVFVANLPGDGTDMLVEASIRLGEAGLVPVPHVVARNIDGRSRLDDMLGRLATEARVRRALVLGGDRDDPAGPYGQSLELIESGLFQSHGITRIGLACYPEGHPRIAADVLDRALRAKLAAARAHGLDVMLISQFAFEPAPIVGFARRLRQEGIAAPLRVGVAGPADRATLVRYALRCGVGASLRALRERQDLARNVLSGETPEALLTEVATAQAADPSLGVIGVHFFTFGAPAKSIEWAEAQRR